MNTDNDTKQKLEDLPLPMPFESTVFMKDSERKEMFAQYMERFQDRMDVDRQTAYAMLAKRTGRTIWAVTSWLTRSSASSERKHAAIPWATMDLLLIEELIMDAGKSCGCSKYRLRGLERNYMS